MIPLRFVKVNPTENMTVLVRDAVPRRLQPLAAARLMAYGSVGAEQVGFIERPDNASAMARLQMMGGEFCGNAAMSLAAVLARDGGLSSGHFTLEVSGCEGLVSCRLEEKDGETVGTVSMPLPERVGEFAGYPAVFFPGIAHLIAPAADFPQKERAEAFLRRAAQETDLAAAGLMLLDRDAMAMLPCVYVRATDSAVWERGCASGTAALGAYLALAEGLGHVSVREPGGVMSADAACADGRVAALTVSGSVRIAAEGTAWIEDMDR